MKTRLVCLLALFFLGFATLRVMASTEVVRESVAVDAEEVAVTVWGREVTKYRLAMEFPDVAERARVAEERIRAALGKVRHEPLTIEPVQLGDERGFAVYAGATFLLKVMDGDLAPSAERDATARVTLARLQDLIKDHADQHSVGFLSRAALQVAAGTVVFALFWTLSIGVRGWLLRRIEKSNKLAGHGLRLFGMDWRPILLGLANGVTRLIMLVAILGVAYGWLTFVLSRFPYTRQWSDQLGRYVLEAVGELASGAVHQVPNLIALILIYVVTRGLIRVLNAWFYAVESGRYLSVWFDAESARATRRLADIAVWIVALIVAFPYLPGSHSEAFRGITVFLGLMLSLGGSGFVGQIIGGLAAVYSRAVRVGDYIAVGETQGVVKEMGLLTTKVVTRNREEVTFPNSMLINSAIRNFTRVGQGAALVSSSVTIGYDTPWRQVEALLLKAAEETDGLLKEPRPYVLQTKLDDFYVHYELTAFAPSGAERVPALARLNGRIQDAFNQHGVQIMSPHFRNQPDKPVVVPPDQWHLPPANKA